jgi:hypothetical protein
MGCCRVPNAAEEVLGLSAGTVGGPRAGHAGKLAGSERIHAWIIRVVHCNVQQQQQQQQQQAGRQTSRQLEVASVRARPAEAHQIHTLVHMCRGLLCEPAYPFDTTRRVQPWLHTHQTCGCLLYMTSSRVSWMDPSANAD